MWLPHGDVRGDAVIMSTVHSHDTPSANAGGRRAPSRRAALAAAMGRLGPGLSVVAVGVAVAYAVSRALPWLSALTVAVALGAVLRNSGLLHDRLRPGTTLATRRLLRAGVVLLGLQLDVPQVLSLGAGTLAVVVVTVTVTFFGTLLIGRWLRVRRGTSLLVATGFSICGAAAVAAMESVAEAEEDEVATAVALITLYGGIALAVLPVLADPLGFSDREFGVWAGASVHEVAQVVAAASAVGAAALSAAVVVKLTRVVLLAPLVTGVSLTRRRAANAARRNDAAQGTDGVSGRDSAAGAERVARPPLVPLFVAGFLTMVLVRSTGLLPTAVLDPVKTLTTLLLAAALFGLGTAVHVPTLVRTGGRAVVLGAVSTVLAALVSGVGVALVG